MSRYIDAEKLCFEILEEYGISTGGDDVTEIYGMIINQPTADVRENVRGEWLSGDCMGASCSKCGEYFSFRTFSEVHNFNFCPNCGADMRGKE